MAKSAISAPMSNRNRHIPSVYRFLGLLLIFSATAVILMQYKHASEIKAKQHRDLSLLPVDQAQRQVPFQIAVPRLGSLGYRFAGVRVTWDLSEHSVNHKRNQPARKPKHSGDTNPGMPYDLPIGNKAVLIYEDTDYRSFKLVESIPMPDTDSSILRGSWSEVINGTPVIFYDSPQHPSAKLIHNKLAYVIVNDSNNLSKNQIVQIIKML